MKVIDLRPGNFEKACGFFSLFIIFLTVLLCGKYRDQNTNYRLRRGITYTTSSRGCSTGDIVCQFRDLGEYNLEFHRMWILRTNILQYVHFIVINTQFYCKFY
jgi:hypothetical protein